MKESCVCVCVCALVLYSRICQWDLYCRICVWEIEAGGSMWTCLGDLCVSEGKEIHRCLYRCKLKKINFFGGGVIDFDLVLQGGRRWCCPKW